MPHCKKKRVWKNKYEEIGRIYKCVFTLAKQMKSTSEVAMSKVTISEDYKTNEAGNTVTTQEIKLSREDIVTK
jgi:hypothetical protein